MIQYNCLINLRPSEYIIKTPTDGTRYLAVPVQSTVYSTVRAYGLRFTVQTCSVRSSRVDTILYGLVLKRVGVEEDGTVSNPPFSWTLESGQRATD